MNWVQIPLIVYYCEIYLYFLAEETYPSGSSRHDDSYYPIPCDRHYSGYGCDSTTSTQEPPTTMSSSTVSSSTSSMITTTVGTTTTTEPPCIEGVNCENKDGNIQLIY